MWVQPPGVGKIPWRRKWQPAPVFLPGESHGLTSLVGYSRWGCKESDMHAINIILMPKERGSREQRSTLERDVCSNLQGHGGHSPGQAVGNKQTSRPGGQYPRHQHREAGSS